MEEDMESNPVWEFIEEPDGELVRCKMCHAQLSRNPTDLFSHLREKHPEEVEKGLTEKPEGSTETEEQKNFVENLSDADIAKILVKKPRSAVWKLMEKLKDTEEVECRICKARKRFEKGTTTNLLRHVKLKHSLEYKAAQAEIDEEKIAATKLKEALGISCKPILFPQEGLRRSQVWKYMDTDESLKRCICNLCGKIMSYCGGSTTNLTRHLLFKHCIDLRRKEKIMDFDQPGSVAFTSDCESQNGNEDLAQKPEKNQSGENVFDTDIPKILEKKPRSAVWKFMEKLKDTEEFECRICKTRMKYDGCSLINLVMHVKMEHAVEYKAAMAEIEEEKIASTKINQTLDANIFDTDIAKTLEKRPRSAVWKFMVKLKDTNEVECRICKARMKCEKGTTSNLLRHVKFKHTREYLAATKIIETLDENVPDIPENIPDIPDIAKILEKKPRSAVWKFMVKLKGTKEVECRICKARMKSCEKGTTSNLLRHVKFKHTAQYKAAVAEIEKEKIAATKRKQTSEPVVAQTAKIRSKRFRSFVWEYMDELNDRESICTICGQVISLSASTTSMARHLWCKHSIQEKQVNQEDSKSQKKDDLSHKSESPDCGANGEKHESQVWNFMENLGGKHVKCKLCGALLLLHTGMSNPEYPLVNHLQYMHADALVKNEGKLMDVDEKEVKVLNETEAVVPEEEVVVKEEVANTSSNDMSPMEFSNPEEDEPFSEDSDRSQSSYNEEHIQSQSQHFLNGSLRQGYLRSDTLCNVGNSLADNASIVWNFMKRTSPSVATCRLCQRDMQRHMPALLAHIRHQHYQEYRRFRNRGLILTHPKHMKDGPRRVRKTNSDSGNVFDSTDHIQVSHLVVNMVTNDLYPCRFVESESFIKLVNTLNPSVAVPDKEMIEESISELHSKYKDLLQMEIKELEGISISTEIWTYRIRELYLSVSAHFISSSWELKSVVLKTALLNSNVNLEESIAYTLRDILSEWDVLDKVVCIVTDNGKDMASGVLRLEKPHLPCIAHTLNQIVQDCLKLDTGDFAYLAKRVRDIAQFLRHSPLASDKLSELQTEAGKTPQELVQDSKTSWLSTHKMFKCYVELHHTLETVLDQINHNDSLLTAGEVEQLSTAVQALEPFALAAEDMASDDRTLLSKCIPMLEILKQMTLNHIQGCLPDSFLEEDDPEIVLARDLAEHVDKCISNLRKMKHLLPLTSTLLDPRFKHTVPKCPDIYKLVRAELQKSLNQEDAAKQEPKSVIGARPGSLLWHSFDEAIEQSAQEEPVDELQGYMNEKSIRSMESPLLFWRDREQLYPKLCKLAKQFLSIPATSLPPKQIFSEETDSMSRRNSLEEHSLDSILFLQSCQLML